jgi:transposase
VDRGKCGTALHVACDARAMPLGVVVTGANADDGCQTEDVLHALVVQPPTAVSAVPCLDPRDLPRAQADGAYGNGPTQARAWRAGFRLQAPKRGHAQPGVGKIRNAVERCHNFFAQFGRVFRRFDRLARHYLGWLELAACIILLRSGFVS